METVSILDRRVSFRLVPAWKETCLAVVLCTKGVCFPGLGGAAARASIEGVKVAVKRHVWRSLGMASNN